MKETSTYAADTQLRWAFRELPQDPKTVFPELPELVGRLLLGRGIKDKESAARFLQPDYERDTHDPFLLCGMERAASRIVRAMQSGQRIVVFGDYDADGVCGAAVFSDFFRAAGYENFSVYIPDRNTEGYGLSQEAVARFLQEGAKIIITIDCGVTNTAEIAAAQKGGADVIVIDHHVVPPVWPDAYAILDPKHPEDRYPFPFLCGAGLAFKTVSAVLASANFGLVPGWERWLLDLVAIATVADMVPIVGENRALVHWGLAVLHKTRRAGLRLLFRNQRLQQNRITAEDVAFTIAPRINVASRLGHARTSFALLTGDAARAPEITAHLEEKNNERRALVDEVLREVRTRYGAQRPHAIIAGDARWQPGVLGVAANRLLEEYSCPVFLWGKGPAAHIKGSCRSNTVNVVDVLREMPGELLRDFGGHVHSGGFALNEEHLGAFEENLRGLLGNLPAAAPEPLLLDAELSIDAATPEIHAQIAQFAPFGRENPQPVFLFRRVPVAGVRFCGKDNAHLALTLEQSDGKPLAAVGFWKGRAGCARIRPGDIVDIAASIEEDFFNGGRTLRLRLAEISAAAYMYV